MEDNYPIADKVEYIIAFVNEFGNAHGLSDRQAYRYLERFKAIDFLDQYYGVAHTRSFADMVNEITAYCHRHGGAIA
ncbi:MAG: DUF3791 domain-containing protein [Prevotellaceae bacterium]|nr:DUF3791 domain-containing protein [Prevotellaceae bacterium]